MTLTNTTGALQHYLDEPASLRGEAQVDPIVRPLLERTAQRLQTLCATLLFRNYPRLARPPMNLRSEEMLSAVVERLLNALQGTRSGNVRQFFQIANQHMRLELNDLARRFDEHTRTARVLDDIAVAPESSGSPLSPVTQRLFSAIDALPEDEREAFSLVRIQGLNNSEASDVLGVSTTTVQRRVNRALLLLSESVGDPRPGAAPTVEK